MVSGLPKSFALTPDSNFDWLMSRSETRNRGFWKSLDTIIFDFSYSAEASKMRLRYSAQKCVPSFQVHISSQDHDMGTVAASVVGSAVWSVAASVVGSVARGA